MKISRECELWNREEAIETHKIVSQMLIVFYFISLYIHPYCHDDTKQSELVCYLTSGIENEKEQEGVK